MRHDPLLAIRNDLVHRIDDLQCNCARMNGTEMCEALGDIRRIAGRHQLDAIERLASLLSSVIAYNGHRQVALNYLNLMRDAAQAIALDTHATQIFLAAAAVRGCR
jgi:hypothetical protein